MNKDLTVGEPSSVLFRFCMPLLGSVVFQQLYNIADSLVVGRFVGENALAAVGNAYEITLIFIAFAFGCNMGCSVIVSRLFGAKDWNSLRTAVSTAFISVAALLLGLIVSGLAGCTAMLRLINTPESLIPDCRLYLIIYLLGLPFLFYYNVSTGIFSAMGDSRTPFLFLSISSCSNILVDILFVKAFGMGVAGVAWATFLCQGISCVLSVSVVMKRLAVLPKNEAARPARFSWPLLRRMLVIALPSTLQQSFISVGNIVIQSVINAFGTSVIAGYAAAIKLNNLVITGFTQLGNGMSTYASQNLGAGRKERMKPGFFGGLKLALIFASVSAAFYCFLPDLPLSMFIGDHAEGAMLTGRQFLRIVSPFYLVVCVKLIADGILRGVGRMREFMIATFTDLILRVGLCFVFSLKFGSVGIWCAWPVGWIIGTVASCIFLRKTLSHEFA